MAKNLTIGQLTKACNSHKYLLLRFKDNTVMGINTKISELSHKRFSHNNETETQFISYRPCGFHSYISNKYPFIKI